MSGRGGDEILPNQVALMCRLLYFPAAATVPAATLVTLAMGPGVGLAARAAWVLALAALALARVVSSRAYLRRPRSPAEARRWLWLLLGIGALVGCVWSFGGTLLLPVHEPIRESLTAMCLIAALAAGFSALSPVSGAYAALAVPFILPMAAWQIQTGDLPRQTLGVVYLIFLLVMVGAAERTARATREQLRLARENAELAARLGAERDALDRVNTELRLASEAKSRFLGHMSHELRTPLTVILGYSDLLLRDAPERRRAEALERIKSAGGALLAIVNDLLDVASIEAGRLTLHEADFSPAELLGEVVAALRGHPEARDLEVTHALGDGLPARLRADHERLRQVLLNLGVNALRFTPRGRVALSMRRAPGDGPELTLRVEVADTGIGIAREAQPRLFQPFSQLDDPAGRRSGGAGLGLAISRSIIERMGGRIGVDSEPGAGSTFWFEAPVHSAGPAPPLAVRYGARVPEAFAGAVLIGEDQADTREFLARFLREAGCAPVVEAASGRELLAAARGTRFDLLLVDWRMPELDGLAAIAEIRAAERVAGQPRTPVVVVTASALPDEREHCLAAGADAVVEKPVDLDSLAAVLRRWLRAPTPGAAAAPPAGGARRAVLVADDHAGNRQLLKEMLEEEGFARVEAVATGLEAVAAWEQGIYDVLLLDWQMPGLDGLGALRHIRALERELGRPRTAVVIVTGRLGDAERAACVAAGADAWVAKPYSPHELLDAVERAVQSVGR
jgi:two-component system, sensor histidine kinase and response regulator